MLSKNNKLKEINNFNITKFSNTYYSNFKSFKSRINDYDKYLEEYENKIDKEKYKGVIFLKYLRKRVYGDVNNISTENYSNYKIDKSVDIKKYKNHFTKYLNDNENESIILDIIKMYLFIKDSLLNTKLYIDSNAQNFFK